MEDTHSDRHDRMREMVFSLYDQALSGPEREEAEKHLESCPDCGKAYRQWKKIAGTFLKAPEVPSPEALVRRVMDRIEAAAPRGEVRPRPASLRWLVPALGVGLAVWVLFLAWPRAEASLSTEALLLADGSAGTSAQWMFDRETAEADEVLGFVMENP